MRWMSRLAVAFTVVGSFVAATLVSAAPPGACEPWPTCREQPSPSPSAASKEIPTGLSTSGFSSPFYTTRYRVATLNAYWDQLEPTQGNKTYAPIAGALDQAEAAGITTIRVRPFLGVRAPGWAKALDDGPITYTEPQSGATQTVPDIWSPAYQASVRSLIDWLAPKLDADPRVRLVFATGGMLAFGEPFIRGIASIENRQAFLAAGYTKTKDAALERWQLDIMATFDRTPIGLAYNPWQYINADGTAGSSLVETAAIMDHHIGLFGAQAVLTNHSIRSSYIADPPPLYELFRARPSVAHQFQTAAASRIGDLRATLDWGIDYLDASVIETYAGAWSELSLAEIAEYDSRLREQL